MDTNNDVLTLNPYKPRGVKMARACEKVKIYRLPKDRGKDRLYWEGKIKDMEKDILEIFNEDEAVLKSSLPPLAYRIIERMLGFKSCMMHGKLDWWEDEGGAYDLPHTEVSEGKLLPCPEVVCPFPEDSIPDSDMIEEFPSESNFQELKQPKGRQRNMYDTFLRKPAYLAARWRYKDYKMKDREKDLEKRADALAQRVINKFLDWFRSIGGFYTPVIDEVVMWELFDVNVNTPYSRSVHLCPAELPFLPSDCLPSGASVYHTKQHGLRRLLMKDLTAERTPSRVKAFGTAILTVPPRFKRPNNKVFQTFVEPTQLPQNLSNQRALFEGLEELKSTSSFCDYMWATRNSRDLPPYLQQIGKLPTPQEGGILLNDPRMSLRSVYSEIMTKVIT